MDDARALPDHPRLRPARPDLAARSLQGRVEAGRFVDPAPMQVTAAIAPLLRRPDPAAPLDTELLHGERFEVLETRDGWCWGQSATDGYVGYVPADCLAAPGPEPTHRVSALIAQIYPAANIKTRPAGWLPLGARVAVAGTEGRFLKLAAGGLLCEQHAVPLDAHAADWVAEAERLLGSPYLWGGRSPIGLDCSALVQLSRQAAGLPTPRDSDMQEASMGRTLPPGTPPARGDLVFWKGHVGIMLDAERLLHANANAMAVSIEPLGPAIRRIEAAGDGPVTRHARLDSGEPRA